MAACSINSEEWRRYNRLPDLVLNGPRRLPPLQVADGCQSCTARGRVDAPVRKLPPPSLVPAPSIAFSTPIPPSHLPVKPWTHGVPHFATAFCAPEMSTLKEGRFRP
jgi:hypothetical protein